MHAKVVLYINDAPLSVDVENEALSLCPLGNFLCSFVEKVSFFETLSGISAGCKTIWIQIRPKRRA